MPDDYRDNLYRPSHPALDLDAIRARRAAITDAPWEVENVTGEEGGSMLVIRPAGQWTGYDVAEHVDDDAAAFIAAAPTDIDALLARVAELEAALDRERERADRNETHGRNLKHETGKLRAELKRLRADANAIRANAGNPDLL